MATPIDSALDELAHSELHPPELGGELAAAFADVSPVAPRRPTRQLAFMCLASMAFAAGLVAVISIRRDFDALPRAWYLTYGAAWILSFGSIAWIALVPPKRSSLIRWRAASIATVVSVIVFVVMGLGWTESVAESKTYEPTLLNVIKYAPYCLTVGVVTAIVPGVLAAMALRRAVPVGSRWVGAAVGAAGGSLGGLVLHVHCPIAEPMHVGLVHGGSVFVAALLGALVMPRFVEP